MDIRCKTCGEPWEVDSLHGLAAEDGITFDQARQEFYKYGCVAFSTGHAKYAQIDQGTGEIIAELQFLMGDDVDGLAGLLEDFGL